LIRTEFISMNSDLLPAVMAGGAVVLVLGLVQLYLGLKAQKTPRMTGKESMIGSTGIIRKTKGFRNRYVVEIRGELWWCLPEREGLELRVGTPVEVVSVDGDSMLLKVRPVDGPEEGGDP